MTNVEPLIQRHNCRWIVKVCGKVLCKSGKQLPQEFKTKEAAIKAGEKQIALNRQWASI